MILRIHRDSSQCLQDQAQKVLQRHHFVHFESSFCTLQDFDRINRRNVNMLPCSHTNITTTNKSAEQRTEEERAVGAFAAGIQRNVRGAMKDKNEDSVRDSASTNGIVALLVAPFPNILSAKKIMDPLGKTVVLQPS